MLFTAFAVASLVALPIHASEKPAQEPDWLGPCGPAQDMHKTCAPGTITNVPELWICKAAQGVWEVIEEHCEMKKRQDDEHLTPDGDWHIGCDEPGHCGYYQDHPNKRSVDADPNTSTRLVSARSSPRDSPDWLDIPDRNSIDTRCSLTSIELVEKFNGQHWVHHYKCPPGTSCTDILGSGACRAGLYEFTIPGRSYLWTFDCPDALEDPSTCHFSDRMHAPDHPKPHEPYLTGTTRCSANGRAVQYFDGDAWTDVYACKAEALCVESEGRGGCRAGQSLSYPPTNRSLSYADQAITEKSDQRSPVKRAEEYRPQTRCHPEYDGRVQFFSKWYYSWIDFYKCDDQSYCYTRVGKAQCEFQDKLVIPFMEFPNGIEDAGAKPLVQIQHDDHVSAPEQQRVTQNRGYVHTRCDPLDKTSRFVQYLNPTTQQWLSFYECVGLCSQFSAFAGCDKYGGKFVVPHPRTETVSKRDAPQDLDACLPPRQAAQKPKEPDFHTIDTRCNPFDLNEVQRYNGTHWIHHYQCTFLGSCIDVDGHGACRLQDNVYELPSANRTSVKQGEGVNPLRVTSRCNKSNASEVLEWQGRSWEPQGVCLPPYECFDFDGSTDFALCVHTDARYRRMWLPWPSLSRSANSGQVTRCRDQETLEQFKGNAWVPYRRCNGIFKCREVEGGLNGGCAAPSLYDILTQPGVHNYKDHTSRDSAVRLPKREEIADNALENSEIFAEHGQILINKDEDLTTRSNSLLETFFSPRDNYPPFGDSSATDDHDSDVYPPDTAKDRANHRRNNGGIVDESVDMHQLGTHVGEEGNKLVSPDGFRTDEYIETIIQAQASAAKLGIPVDINLSNPAGLDVEVHLEP